MRIEFCEDKNGSLFFESYSGTHWWYSNKPRIDQLHAYSIQLQRTRPLLWTHGQHLPFRTDMAVSTAQVCRRLSPFQPRFLLQELIRAHFPFQRRGSSHGGHLPEVDWLSRECRENRKRHLHPCRYQLLTAERHATNLSIVAQNTDCRCPLGQSCCFMQYGSLARPQRFGSEINNSKPPTLALARPWHSGRFVASMAERDVILKAFAELPDPAETAPARWLGQSVRTPALVSTEHKVASTSHHFPATTSNFG